jgi:DNA-binding response OmpR family regulator
MLNHVLLVESDTTLAKYLAELLGEHSGCACHHSPSLDEGLERLDTGTYWLAVIDLDLLDDRSRHLAAELRKSYPELRLIGLDSLPSPPVDPDGSFDAIIQKPFIAEPLVAALPGLRESGVASRSA